MLTPIKDYKQVFEGILLPQKLNSKKHMKFLTGIK